jgi:putative nucleotidyltransferase with HDIG domain
MNDKSSELENYNELKFSREQGFFDKSIGIRLLIGFLSVLSLFLFLHFREVSVEVLELNKNAPSYIVAQNDFDFYDEEATLIQKQEAVRDVGKIYLIADKSIRQRRMEFENDLITKQDWRKEEPKGSLEQMYRAIDGVGQTLTQMRFSDPRTLQKMRDMGIFRETYQIYTPLESEEGGPLPRSIWEGIRKITLLDNTSLSPQAVDYVVDFLKNKNWPMEEDILSERNLRRKIQNEVPDKITHVNAGSRIIDQGERVSSRHIAMLQAMKQALNDQRNLWHILPVLGSLLLTLILIGICIVYFQVNHPKILYSNRKLFLLVTVTILTLGIAKATEFFLLNSNHNLIEVIRYPILVPFAAILICSLMNHSIATFVSAFLAIVMTVALAFEHDGFMLINICAAIVAILSTRSLRRRKEIFVVCAKALLCAIGVIIALHLYRNTLWTVGIWSDILSAIGFMLFTAVLVVGLLPLLESTFRIMTDVTLMEYMDPNNDLLRRLTIEAPGTYQHSVVVGNLAEAAASAIGANGLFCRVATLYHDVGKMATPQYFTENQQNGMNIHQLLTPQESAQVIMAHVSEGVSLARKAGLPEQFIDIIKEHHGTTLVYYFYAKAIEKVGGDKTEVDEKEFRYSGPKPRSKESAIIMIADSIEAASRSLEKVTEDSLMELSNRLIREKAEDGQFDECLLTFEELAIVKSILVKTLVAFGHSRIKYPKREQRKVEPNLEA